MRLRSDTEQDIDDTSFWHDIAAGLLLIVSFPIGCAAVTALAGLITYLFS